MPKFLTNLIINHKSLDLFYQLPGLVRLQHAVAWLITQRYWYVYRELKRILKKREGSCRVIDVGCASGEILFPLSRRFPNCEYTGIDISDEALKTCEIVAEHRDIKRIKFIKSTIQNFELEEYPDLVFSVSLLQLVPDREKAVTKLVSFLKPGAVLLIYVPVNYKRIIPGYQRLRSGWLKRSDYGFYHPDDRNLSEDRLRQQLHQAGAVAVESKYCYGTPGKIAYELISLGQLMTLRLNWLLAIPFALLYFSLTLLPAWLLMGIDMLYTHRSGNGLIMIVQK